MLWMMLDPSLSLIKERLHDLLSGRWTLWLMLDLRLSICMIML